jgi:uncharacterized protein YkwD
LNNLASSDAISKVARKHSEYLCTTGKVGHEGPIGEQVDQRLRNAGVAWLGCGENVAYAEGYDDPIKIMVDGWMRSPGHQANILAENFTSIGVGLSHSASPTTQLKCSCSCEHSLADPPQ